MAKSGMKWQDILASLTTNPATIFKAGYRRIDQGRGRRLRSAGRGSRRRRPQLRQGRCHLPGRQSDLQEVARLVNIETAMCACHTHRCALPQSDEDHRCTMDLSGATPMGGPMEVTVEHLGAVQFEIKSRQHTLICDQPAESKGYDEGMTPPELLLASLGSCAAYYAVDYLVRNKIAREGVKTRITAEKVKGPFRLDNFKIEVDVPGDLTERAAERPRRRGAPLPDSQHPAAAAQDRRRHQRGRAGVTATGISCVTPFSQSPVPGAPFKPGCLSGDFVGTA